MKDKLIHIDFKIRRAIRDRLEELTVLEEKFREDHKNVLILRKEILDLKDEVRTLQAKLNKGKKVEEPYYGYY